MGLLGAGFSVWGFKTVWGVGGLFRGSGDCLKKARGEAGTASYSRVAAEAVFQKGTTHDRLPDVIDSLHQVTLLFLPTCSWG